MGFIGQKGEKGNMGVAFECQPGLKGNQGPPGPPGRDAAFPYSKPEGDLVGPVGDKGERGYQVSIKSIISIEVWMAGLWDEYVP